MTECSQAIEGPLQLGENLPSLQSKPPTSEVYADVQEQLQLEDFIGYDLGDENDTDAEKKGKTAGNNRRKKKATNSIRKQGQFKKPHVKKNISHKYQCEKCPKSFNHSSSLLYHRIAVHDTLKKFTCETCGRAFAHKQLLNNHMYVHSDEKVFACDVCTAKFKSR
jgi:hypothetical protein